MKSARSGHGVFIQQGVFVVVGGIHYTTGYESKRFTERCTLNGDAFECELVGPELDYYWGYPEMIRVPYDYCPK